MDEKLYSFSRVHPEGDRNVRLVVRGGKDYGVEKSTFLGIVKG